MRAIINDKARNRYLYIGIILIYLLSGSYLYWGYAPILLIVSMIYTIMVYKYNRHIVKADFFRSYSFYYILLVALSMLVWGCDDLTFITYLIVPVFSYNLFKLTSYEDFKTKWLGVTTLISLWSIFAWLLLLLEFPVSTVQIGDFKCELILGINFRVAESRLCGLCFEPGVYQIYLVFTLLMWVKEIRIWELSKKEKIYLLTCLLTLLAIQSTMGYLGLMMVLGALIASKDNFARFKKSVALIIVLIPFIFMLFTSSVVQNKLNEEDGNESYSIRIIDTMAAYRMIEDSPILGNGVGNRWTKLAEKYGNITNSNGVLNMISRLGIFWIILYILFLVKFSRRNKVKILPLYFVIAVLVPLFNEDVVYTPLAFIFASKFR